MTDSNTVVVCINKQQQSGSAPLQCFLAEWPPSGTLVCERPLWMALLCSSDPCDLDAYVLGKGWLYLPKRKTETVILKINYNGITLLISLKLCIDVDVFIFADIQ